MGIDAQMFVRTMQPITPEQVLEKAYLLASAFGHEKFWIFRDDYSGKPRHCLEPISVYEQDGPDIKPEPGEAFIECHPATRYYGEGYARGDLPFLIAVARWLDHHFPGGVVWYGGDSSGVCAAPFTEPEREKLWRHFCEDRNSYASHFSSGPAQMCSWCRQPMIVNTWFGRSGNIGCYCPGCDERVYLEVATGTAHRFTDKTEYERFAEAQRTKALP